MDVMPSSEFRRRYAALTRPTQVTVNGHPIGEWRPFVATAAHEAAIAPVQPLRSRPFTPAPKPGR